VVRAFGKHARVILGVGILVSPLERLKGRTARTSGQRSLQRSPLYVAGMINKEAGDGWLRRETAKRSTASVCAESRRTLPPIRCPLATASWVRGWYRRPGGPRTSNAPSGLASPLLTQVLPPSLEKRSRPFTPWLFQSHTVQLDSSEADNAIL
jgi:hypothetical protein